MEIVELTTPVGKILRLGAICAAFTIAGIWMVMSGEFLTIIGGAVGIAFFGGCGAWALLKMWRQRVVLRLTPTGLESMVGPIVPWDNVGDIGVGHYKSSKSAPMVGLRLLDYDRYIGSLSPSDIRKITAAAKAGRYVGVALTPSTVGVDTVLDAIPSRDLKKLLPTWDLLSIPQKGIARQLAWTRNVSGGWDLLWAGSIFEQDVSEVVKVIDGYRHAVRGRS